MDVVDSATRSRMMAGIRGKDTKPELIIRKGLSNIGYRYVLHDKRLPGKPDLVFPKYNAVILINGCFWHGHDCNLFKWPKTQKEFWQNKINSNKERDIKNNKLLSGAGWRVLTIWECAVKGKSTGSLDKVVDTASRWLANGNKNMEITGCKLGKGR